MPIHHKKDGWYWGSKGPFPTKTKAKDVMKAAFASGYEPKESCGTIFEAIFEKVMDLGAMPRTTNWKTAGLIDPQGKLIDMRKADGSRMMHRELATNGGKELSDEVLSKGYIRINAPQGVLHIEAQPTTDQYVAISAYLKEARVGGRLHLSLYADGHAEPFWKEYGDGTTNDRIINTIKQYYAEH